MTLKIETERLENSSNKIKTVKANINKELVAKGSTNANTLAEIPDLINNLNLEDVKFATGNCNKIVKSNQRDVIILHDITLDFEPIDIYVLVNDNSYASIKRADIEKKILVGTGFAVLNWAAASKNQFSIAVSYVKQVNKLQITKWIAIG